MMMGEYLDFVSQMLLAFGIVFELPLFILFLSIVGIVNYLQLIRFGRWFVLVAFTIGAIITPPDTTSQIVMSIPLCVLVFRLHRSRPTCSARGRAKRRSKGSRAERAQKKLVKKAQDEAQRCRKKAEKEAERLAREEEKRQLPPRRQGQAQNDEKSAGADSILKPRVRLVA